MIIVTSAVILEPKKLKSIHCWHFLPIYLPWSDRTRCHDLSLLNVEFEPAFSLSFFTLIKRLFSSFLLSLSAIWVVSSAYPDVVYISPGSLDSSGASSSPAFHMMPSACKLDKQGDSMQPWCTLFPVFDKFYVWFLEKAMAPHSSTLAWKIPWTEEPGRLQSIGLLPVGHDWATSLSLFTFMHWRRKCNPLQCSCLENPRDEGAWWAAVYGVAQGQTRLKRLSSSSSSMSGSNCCFLTLIRCFCGIPLLFLWYSGCWQFDLWFLCLF